MKWEQNHFILGTAIWTVFVFFVVRDFEMRPKNQAFYNQQAEAAQAIGETQVAQVEEIPAQEHQDVIEVSELDSYIASAWQKYLNEKHEADIQLQRQLVLQEASIVKRDEEIKSPKKDTSQLLDAVKSELHSLTQGVKAQLAQSQAKSAQESGLSRAMWHMVEEQIAKRQKLASRKFRLGRAKHRNPAVGNNFIDQLSSTFTKYQKDHNLESKK